MKFNSLGPPFKARVRPDYFRRRDFEIVQPLYDLAFLLEVGALSSGAEPPKYRTFSLWRAAYSLDGYSTVIDRWMDGELSDLDLDYVPSNRIRQYLGQIRDTGTLAELNSFDTDPFHRCLRLRSVRGLGPNKIALSLLAPDPTDWLDRTGLEVDASPERILALFSGRNTGPWQAAHVIPPLLRFLKTVQMHTKTRIGWGISNLNDPFENAFSPVQVTVSAAPDSMNAWLKRALNSEKFFSRVPRRGVIEVVHQMGWSFTIGCSDATARSTAEELAERLDPLASLKPSRLRSDLHLHTVWSDGSATVNAMAEAIGRSGLEYFAVTDHSRSSKLQGGLTPPLWLRQATALALAAPLCPVIHGIEVDILRDGTIDLPMNLLSSAGLVIGSVHSNWTDDCRKNTDRLVTAIESGAIDVLGHPTSGIIGKPGVPDYTRSQAQIDWEEVFDTCRRYGVSLEFNCFPSRLDLPLNLAKTAIDAGCSLSIGSDAHARSHLLNLLYGDFVIEKLGSQAFINSLGYGEITAQIAKRRAIRRTLSRSKRGNGQIQFEFGDGTPNFPKRVRGRVAPPQSVPAGSKVIGIDLTAGEKATGIAKLDGYTVETKSLVTDDEIIAYIKQETPQIISIDSPLGLPGGGTEIDPGAGIVRVAEQDLASIGIPAYPALIDSMQNLTLRGIKLRRIILSLPFQPLVIESYPGAAQDILSIPRKQQGLELLREGLGRLGLRGPGLKTRSHDEMDAITSAIVGRYFEAGQYEPMGIESEAQLIVPKVPPVMFDDAPIICLAGKTGAGKSVVARYLSVFYGFQWMRTRNVIRELLIEDQSKPKTKRLFERRVNPELISEADLREFGAVVLDRYRQVPLREKLAFMLVNERRPVVLDSIRDLVDVEERVAQARTVLIWFIDASESVILARLRNRKKLSEDRIRSASPVDHTAAAIRNAAHYVITNNASLEDLRWRIDDTLFDCLELVVG
jgi:histidinol phosphatase-like PHP family hydrolase/predicted nuclease with RNAse H fold/dephospho-CoA kinase